ncbi:hypothetical protein RAAC3_TM7C00001G0329 [Candidatus Saccharibacteria bacterium RAAC3_TM7_1]|nr:hypothetical protein RAAC3_TM7C00001G0329 [Candidatus Saccharibacteria bacterium RAAC3_TM7_1]
MFASLYTLAATKISGSDINIPRVEADSVLASVLNIAYFAAGITAVIVVIVGGIFYAISYGDMAKVKRGKDMILYGVIGLVFVMIAFTVTNFIVGWF